jgi:hypothetical protein
MSDYKPTEHGGLRQDGQPDKRVGTGGITSLIFFLTNKLLTTPQSLLKERSTPMRQESRAVIHLEAPVTQSPLVLVTAAVPLRVVSTAVDCGVDMR